MQEENITILYSDYPLSWQKIIILSIQNSEATGKRYTAHILAFELREILNYENSSNSIYENLSKMQGKISLAQFLIKTPDGYFLEKPLYRKADYKNGIFVFEFSKDSKPYMDLMKQKIEDYNFCDLLNCKNKFTLKIYEIIFNKLKTNGRYVSDHHISTKITLEEIRMLLRKSRFKKQKIKTDDETELEVLNLEQLINKDYPRNIEFYEKMIKTPVKELEMILHREFLLEKIYSGQRQSLYGVKITVVQLYEINQQNTLSMEDFFDQILYITKNIPIIFTEMKLKTLFMEANYDKEMIVESYNQLPISEKYDPLAYEYLLKKIKENRMKEKKE